MEKFRKEFLDLCIKEEIMKFGDFTLKSGRSSPYFFNAGGFDTGSTLIQLGRFFARNISASGIDFDVLFGPAYKGIPLAAAIAIGFELEEGRRVPFTYNRKEAKKHGEGGHLVGAPLEGRILIVDDVISAGTSIRESVDIIQAAGAELAGVAVALDRQERGVGQRAASTEVAEKFGAPVISIANLETLINYIAEERQDIQLRKRIVQYRAAYGPTA